MILDNCHTVGYSDTFYTTIGKYIIPNTRYTSWNYHIKTTANVSGENIVFYYEIIIQFLTSFNLTYFTPPPLIGGGVIYFNCLFPHSILCN
jgi:hypothetical protein